MFDITKSLLSGAALLVMGVSANLGHCQETSDVPAQSNIAIVGFDCCACEPDCGCEQQYCEPDCACESSYGGGCDQDFGCGSSCGNGCCCREVCVASVEKEKVEKHCWKVECDKICIPKVVCPWGEGGSGLTLFSWMKKQCGSTCCGDACCGDACCDTACCCGSCCNGSCCSGGCCLKPRCGKVRCVRDLKKETYECDKCVCKWEIKRLPPCCGDGCCGCGCGCGCGDPCCSDPCCGDSCCADPCCGAAAAKTGPTTTEALIQTVSAESELQQPAISDEDLAATEEPAKISWLRRLFSRK